MSDTITAPITVTSGDSVAAPLIYGVSSLTVSDSDNYLEVTRSTVVVSGASEHNNNNPNGEYVWTPASNAFVQGDFKLFKNSEGTVTKWYLYFSGNGIATRDDADLIGNFTISDANYGTTCNVTYGTRSLFFAGAKTDITDILNECAYGDHFTFGRGVFNYSGLIYSSTSTITNGRNFAGAGSDAIGNHRDLAGGLILKSNTYRTATIKLVQSGHDARSGGTMFIALRCHGRTEIIDLVIDANAESNIAQKVIREDAFRLDPTELVLETFKWAYTGSRGNSDPLAASRQGGAGTDNWELNPHYGCYTLRGDKSILRGCKFIGWTAGGCNMNSETATRTDEQYGNNVYGHYCLIEGCSYEEPVDVSWNTPYISIVNPRFGLTVRDTTVFLPDTADDFWTLGSGLVDSEGDTAWASAQTFAFPNHDNTLFENNRAFNCGAMFHRDTLAINGSIMRGNSCHNCGYGVLFAMSGSNICQNIVIEENTFEVRNMNGTTKGTGVKITHAAGLTIPDIPYTYGLTLNNNTIIGVSDIARPEDTPAGVLADGEWAFQMGSTKDWGDIPANFFTDTTFKHNVMGHWSTTDPSTRQVTGVLNNVLDDNAAAGAWTPWDYDTKTSEGFYTTTPTTKPVVTGSAASNAALSDLLTKLAALGLITDSTT